ncbi:MAG: hypothetical protein HN368_13150 [Spirochaetales bacterium]|nr:hypothetical protein [Spirochaetales bacterium]
MKKLIILLVIGISILTMFTGCDELFSLLGVSSDTYDLQAEDVFLNAAGTEVSFTVYNGGSLSVPSAEVWIVLSDDLIIDRNDPTVFSQFISVGAGLSQATTIVVSDFDLTAIAAGTYYIGIIVDPNSSISDDNGGNNSTYAITQLTIGGGTTTGDAPTIPTNLMVDAATSSSLTISWIVVSNATGYNLQWAVSSSGPWNDAPGHDGAAANFTHNSLTNSTVYWYRVEALNSYGASGFSSPISGTTLAGGGTVPFHPLNLIVDNATVNSLDISWDPETNTTGYNLERSDDGGATWIVTGFTGSTTSYTDFGLTGSTTYLYQVEAYNTYGGSGFSPSIAGTTLAGGAAPLSPLNLAVGSPTTNSLVISWDPETDATGYNLERSDDAGATWFPTGFTGSATSYTDFGLTSSTTYLYQVEAYNAFGNSGFSLSAAGTTAGTPPSAPTWITSSNITDQSIQLDWDAGFGATTYDVQRSQDQIFWDLPYQGPLTTFVDSGLAPSTPYWYRVRGVNSNGASAYYTTPTFIMTQAASTAAPQQVNAVGFSLTAFTTQFIGFANLDYSDADSTDNNIRYTLDFATAGGVLRLNSAPLVVASVFTQADINAGLLEFQNTGGAGVYQVNLSVMDETGNPGNISPITLTFNVNPPGAAAPQLVNANGFAINPGLWSGMTSNTLLYSDSDSTDDNILYTVVSVTPGSELRRLSAPLIPGDIFTQAEVSATQIRFANTNSVSGPYDVILSVEDETGNPGNPTPVTLYFTVL